MPEMCEIVNSLPQWLHDETVMTGQSKERRGVTIKTRLRVSERRFRAGDESRRSAASLHFGETRTGCVPLISSSSPQDWNCHAWSRKGKKSQGINWVTKGLPRRFVRHIPSLPTGDYAEWPFRSLLCLFSRLNIMPFLFQDRGCGHFGSHRKHNVGGILVTDYQYRTTMPSFGRHTSRIVWKNQQSGQWLPVTCCMWRANVFRRRYGYGRSPAPTAFSFLSEFKTFLWTKTLVLLSNFSISCEIQIVTVSWQRCKRKMLGSLHRGRGTLF